MKNRWLAVALSGVLAFGPVLSGCSVAPESNDSSSSSQSSQSADTSSTSETDIKYNVQIPDLSGSLCTAPLWIAQQKGFFAEEGVKVQEVSADVDTQKTGLNNGTFPVAMGDFSFFESMESGIDVRVVDAVNLGCIKVIARADDDSINSAADLAGKTVAVNKVGGTPYQVLSLWVNKEAGLSLGTGSDQVNAVVYDDGNLELEALKSGQVDAAAVWDPYGPKAEQDGSAKVLLDNSQSGDFAGRACCFLTASNKVLKENPDEIAAIIRAMHKADQWIADNPEETVQIISDNKYASIDDKDLAVQMIKAYGYGDLATGDHDVEGDVRYYANMLSDLGMLKSSPDDFVSNYYQKVETA